MTDQFDAIMAEVKTAAAAQSTESQESSKDEGAKEESTKNTESGEAAATEQDGDKAEQKDKSFVELPKPVANKISRQDRKIGKLTAEKYALIQELEALKNKDAPKKQAEDKAPKEEDFDTYGEYLDARAEFAADKKYRENQAKQTEEKAKTEADEWQLERAEALDDNHIAAKKAFPDYEKVLEDALSDVEVAPHVKRAVLEAEQGAFALYALAKEGMSLEDLNEMTPYKVAATLARMEDKGVALSKVKQITNAPAPIAPAKGVGNSSKSIDSKSTDELLKWVSS